MRATLQQLHDEIEKENEELWQKHMYLKEHNHNIEALFVRSQYDYVRQILIKIRIKIRESE